MGIRGGISLLLGLVALGLARAEDCPTFDHRSFFPPEREQGDHGYCYSFAASSLLEEDLCRRQKILCNIPLSVVDASRCNFSFHPDARREGGDPREVVDCARKGGVCAEESAPYPKPGMICSLIRLFDGGRVKGQERSKDCTIDQLVEAVEAYQRSMNQAGVCPADGSGGKPGLITDEALSVIRFFLPAGAWDEKHAREVLAKYGSQPLIAMKELLIPPMCRATRFSFFGIAGTVVQDFDSALARDARTRQVNSFLAGARDDQRSAVLGVCYRRYFNEKVRPASESTDACGAHAVIADAMRIEGGECKIHLRNSMGEGAALRGWVRYRDVVPYVTSATRLNLKKAN